MMSSEYNPHYPYQEQYLPPMPEYVGGYQQQPMPYPQQEPMYPNPPQGYGPPYQEPFQQAAYAANEPVASQTMTGPLPGSSVMQPMMSQSTQDMPGNPPMMPQPTQDMPGNPPMMPQPTQDMYGNPPMMPQPTQNMYGSPPMMPQPTPNMLGNQMMAPNQQMPGNQYMQKPTQGFNPFDNPLQPVKRPPQMQQQVYNPYPKQQFMQKQQPSGFKSVMNQFKTQDGSMDVTKMMNTAGQMMNTVSQVSNMVKGVGGFFKV